MIREYIIIVILLIACLVAGYNYGKAEQLEKFVKLSTANCSEFIDPDAEILKNTKK